MNNILKLSLGFLFLTTPVLAMDGDGDPLDEGDGAPKSAPVITPPPPAESSVQPMASLPERSGSTSYRFKFKEACGPKKSHPTLHPKSTRGMHLWHKYGSGKNLTSTVEDGDSGE